MSSADLAGGGKGRGGEEGTGGRGQTSDAWATAMVSLNKLLATGWRLDEMDNDEDDDNDEPSDSFNRLIV